MTKSVVEVVIPFQERGNSRYGYVTTEDGVIPVIISTAADPGTKGVAKAALRSASEARGGVILQEEENLHERFISMCTEYSRNGVIPEKKFMSELEKAFEEEDEPNLFSGEEKSKDESEEDMSMKTKDENVIEEDKVKNDAGTSEDPGFSEVEEEE